MRIGILVFDGVADSGLGLIQDVFAAANLLADRVDEHIEPFEVSLLATRGEIRTAYGLTASARPVDGGDERPEHLLIPSIGVATAEDVVAAVSGRDVVDRIRTLSEQGVPIAAACSGTFFVAETGALDGRPATTSWWLGPCFRERYPDVLLDESRSVVISDTLTTAGAALGHLDLALSLVTRVSPELCRTVADYLAVGDRPTQGEIVRPSVLATSDPVLLAFDRAVRDRITSAIDIGSLAASLGVSQRTLQRLTSSTLGMTPVRYIQQVRLERALDLLRTTDMTLTAVAAAVGYGDATTLATLMRRRHGITPEQVRRRRRFSLG